MSAPRRSLEDLLLLSDFGRADPQRARELLDAAIEQRSGGRIVEVQDEDEDVSAQAA